MSFQYPTDNVSRISDLVRESHRSEYGAVYTRPWVTEFILDLSGYVPSHNLVDAVVIEPSCGDGEFLEPIIRRLSDSCRRQSRPLKDCATSLQAFELYPEAVFASRRRAKSVLMECGWSETESDSTVRGWIREANFLLDPEMDLVSRLGSGIDFVIGNPPYIRLEAIDSKVANHYRKLFRTMVGRADIYVGFYEKALSLLKPGGICGFICPDRWMLNQYGRKLREFITRDFSVDAVIEMHDADPFHEEVLAYPSITVIRRKTQSKALVAKIDGSNNVSTRKMVEVINQIRESPRIDNRFLPDKDDSVILNEWFQGSAPWPCISPKRLELLKRLEAKFAPLENALLETRVGIGVATGADRVFITEDSELVERERLLPIAMAKDTTTGTMKWSGHFLVNPWTATGNLVDLENYPLLQQYFEKNEDLLKKRNVAQRNPNRWFRTIDKVNHDLVAKPKLLIPDIKSSAHPVIDFGSIYPHHNLYYVVSEKWDLRVLGGILLSEVGQFFIECYAVKMHGGYLRFQAQYLRRIRVPHFEQITEEQAYSLAQAFDERDVELATKTALKTYGLDKIPR